MSGGNVKEQGINRRSFLKVGAAGAGFAVSESKGMFSFGNWFNEANADEKSDERVAHVFHKTHCVGPCALTCTIREGRLSLIEPNTWSEKNRDTVCLKALSEIEHVYSSERIQTPLKRAGERGSGGFVSITWDEALATIKEKIDDAKAKYGPESIFLYTSGEADMHYPFLPLALGGQYTPYVGVDTGVDNGFTPAFAQAGGPSATNEIRDWVNSKTIIIIGANTLESAIPDARWFFDAKEAGAEIIVIDPAFSTTASKADQWIPINPGYSSALLLGMITSILENDWYDESFILKYTDLPFLVDPLTGMRIRAYGTTAEEEAGEDNPFMVWDTVTRSVQPYNKEEVIPALRGTYSIDTGNVTTVFSQLEEKHKKYSLSWTSEKTGIDEEVILSLTKKYTTQGPSNITYGFGGPDKWSNADIFGHALVLLGSLTGSIGKKGAGVGFCASGLYTYGAFADLASWDLPEEYGLIGPFHSDLEVGAASLKYTPNKVRVIVNLGDAMFLRGADWNKQKEWIDSLDFILTIDPYHVCSVDYSDIVLPASTRFECRGDYGFVYKERNHMLLQEKVIEPLFDSKTDFEIDIAVSSLFIDKSLLPSTLEELTTYQLEESDDPSFEGITVKSLQENNGIMRLNVPEEPVVLYEDQLYDTYSGRLELYYENLLTWGQELPVFEEPFEAYANNDLKDKYPLQFGQARSKYHIHNQFCEAIWIQQFVEPHVELNPIDGEARGLITGNMAEVFNDRGSFQCTYRSNESVRPGTCRSYYGNWPRFMQKGCVQEVTNGELNPRADELFAGPVVPFNDTLVEVRKAPTDEGGAA